MARLRKRFGVQVTFHTVTVKAKWPKIKPEKVEYPFIMLSSWAESILKELPQYFLGGCSDIQNLEVFSQTLTTFWSKYRQSHPDHPVYKRFEASQLAYVIPYAIHGDEGRGRNFVPTLIIAYQMMIHPLGMDYTNTAS